MRIKVASVAEAVNEIVKNSLPLELVIPHRSAKKIESFISSLRWQAEKKKKRIRVANASIEKKTILYIRPGVR